MSFIPPGEGFWTFDPTHFPRPLSKWMQENYGFEYGSNHARRTVSYIEHMYATVFILSSTRILMLYTLISFTLSISNRAA